MHAIFAVTNSPKILLFTRAVNVHHAAGMLRFASTVNSTAPVPNGTAGKPLRTQSETRKGRISVIISAPEAGSQTVKAERRPMKPDPHSTTCSEMNNQPVVFIDSGIGGLPYLSWVSRRLPDESFVYAADNKHFPYGTRSRAEILDIVTGLFGSLYHAYKPKMAVVACNTASVISLAHLRAAFDIPFIGVVPAVKPAALSSGSKRIGLMATSRTIEDEYTAALIKDFASDCEIFRFGGTDIIDFIENNLHNSGSDVIRSIIKPAADFFIESNVDKVVLGCTHFIFLERELRAMLGDKIELIDSREGVGRQIIRVIDENNLRSQFKSRDIFILTESSRAKDRIENYKWIAEKHGLCLEELVQE